jgi:glucose/arabinose dehydrogenase
MKQRILPIVAQRSYVVAGLCMLCFASAVVFAESAPLPVDDPIIQTIAKGDIVVEAIEFVRAPKTEDIQLGPTTLAGIAEPLGTSKAYARLQYMLPIPDGSGRLAVSDLRGVLYITNAAGDPLQTYLDLRRQAPDFGEEIFPNEAGLLGFAFHPDFGKAGMPGYGKFYTGYSAESDSGVASYLDDSAASHNSVLREWTAQDSTANVFAGSSREVFRVGQFAANHNIGTLAFNGSSAEDSADYGMLYICFGDGGGGYDPMNFGQGMAEPLGAILRIDPLGGDDQRGYGIPQDNPFVRRPDVATEIWAYGLRHPQHFSFDRDGRLFINDIGQSHIEEVNIGVAGANYGWRVREGMLATGFGVEGGYAGFLFPRPVAHDNFTYPVAQYDHDEGNAIGSGFVYRGQAINELQGKYVLADLVGGRLFYFDTDHLNPGEPATIKELRISIGSVERDLIDVVGYENSYAPGMLRADVRLGIDAVGELYLLTKGDGWIRKLVPSN